MDLFEKCMEIAKSCLADAKMDKNSVDDAVLLSEDTKNVPNMVLRDVTPLSLGIEVTGDIMSVVIPRNTSVPFKVVSVIGANGCKL
ncbi:putative Heat shock protein 70 family [Medicago truncatula]|uniref:Putative Heat shock protein 70 family n=1 Tax=Medicago truncatula TaxID=3880 RepID=A0A396GUW4_MEDTR|nr:putative Heat shock protein 70 family [Medicago truncatula]